MGVPTTLPGDFFDQKQEAPDTLPGNFFDQQSPTAIPGSIDPQKLTQALIYSHTINVPPSLAYQHANEIENQMKNRGAGTVWDIPNDIKVGAESSIFGLGTRGKLPENLQNPTAFNEFISGLTTMISDLPFYLAGGAAGGVAGTAAGPEGTVAGAAMGTFAVPEMIRKSLVEGIRKGNIKSFGDYINRFLEVSKAGEKGAITGGMMEVAGSETLPAFGKGTMAAVAKKAQETAAITLIPKLLEGQIPTAKDFGVNAALVGALHLLSGGEPMDEEKAREGLMDSYAKDGTNPKDAAVKLQAQPPVVPDMEPGLKAAIRVTAADGTPARIVADENETHPELAKRMGISAVTMDEINKDPSLADKVLEQPAGQLQQVIDRAFELKKAQGVDVPNLGKLKSGRGFVTPDGKFLSRKQAVAWVKENEPEIHNKWAEITTDYKAEFHSQDYNRARDSVRNRTLAEGDPEVRQWSPELSNFLAGRREELNRIKAEDKSSKYGKTMLRDLFVGPRNMLRAEAEQLRKGLKKIIPDYRDQEALTFLRDYKGSPDELRKAIEEIRAGDNEKLKPFIPSMERALSPSPELLEADRQMTNYFTNALGLGRQVGILESNIDPERYSPRLFMKVLEDEEDARREGRPRFTTRTPHAIQREYLNVLDPLKEGKVEARTLNALDGLSIYADRHSTAVATSILKTELKNSELGKNGSREDVPSNWRQLPGSSKAIVTKDSKTGEARVFHQGFYVPPVVAEAMKPILEQNVLSSTPEVWALNNMQRYIKTAEVGFSVFHMKAMTFMAANNMGWKDADFIKALRSDNSSPEFQAAEREAALWGVTTPTTGTPYEAYQGLKPSSVPSRIDILRSKPGIKQLDEIAHGMTYATFDVVQRKFKVMDFSLKAAAWLSDHPGASEIEYGSAMRSIGKEINAIYGGLNWEMMGWGPNARELARVMFFAPDWTFSNLVNLKYSFEGGPGGKSARAFWFKSAATGLTLTAAASLMFTGKLSKHPAEVYMGTDKEGKEVYSNMFFAGAPKDFVTLLNAVHRDGGLGGAADFIGYKLGPLVGIGPRLLVNRDWSGRPIVSPKQGVLEKTGRQALFAGEQAVPLPFSIKDLVEGMINDPQHDYSYKDFLSNLAGSIARHEGGKRRSRGRVRFSITGR